jgi:hypothetical protein
MCSQISYGSIHLKSKMHPWYRKLKSKNDKNDTITILGIRLIWSLDTAQYSFRLLGYDMSLYSLTWWVLTGPNSLNFPTLGIEDFDE